MSSQIFIFLVLVGGTVFLLSIALTVPVYGTAANTVRKTRERVKGILDSMSEETRSILKQRINEHVSPLGRALSSLPFMDHLGRVLEQVGARIPPHQFVLLSIAAGIGAFVVGLVLTGLPLIALLAGIGATFAPYLMLTQRRDKRLAQFEAQLPDALSMISRALRAGLPFTDALKIAGQESPDPMGAELRTTFGDINYGMGLRDGLLNLMARVPSLSLTTVVTAVLVQRESGGNLAEILDKVAAVVRSRYKLQRRIMTLSAEARMSAWVMALMPLVLAAGLFLTSPEYLRPLVEDPNGPKLITGSIVGLVIGVFWMRQVMRIRV